MVKGFLVEEFGRVRAHQSHALNYHLACTVARFDDAYRQAGGRLGSAAHLQARTDYARDLAADLLRINRHDDGPVRSLHTESHVEISDGKVIDLVSHSDFDRTPGPAAGTKGSPFPSPWVVKLARALTGPAL